MWERIGILRLPERQGRGATKMFHVEHFRFKSCRAGFLFHVEHFFENRLLWKYSFFEAAKQLRSRTLSP